MGKTAENEQRKLRGAFYNNIAAGLVLTGILLPALTFTQIGYELGVWLKAYNQGAAAITKAAVAHLFIVATSAIAALLGARLCRAIARKAIGEIAD